MKNSSFLLLVMIIGTISLNGYSSDTPANYKKKLRSLLSNKSNSSLECASVEESPSKINAENLITKINEMFGTQLKLQLELEEFCGIEFVGISSTAGDGPNDGVIAYCDRFFKNLDNNVCGKTTNEAMAFIVAHESAHRLFEFVADNNFSINLDKQAAKDFLALPENMKKQVHQEIADLGDNPVITAKDDKGKTTEYIRWVSGQVEHEYIDALAAKILKSLGYDKNIVDGVDCMAKLITEKIPENYLSKRREVILSAYSEGWSDWKDFKKMEPINDQVPLKKFLEKNGYHTISKKLFSAELSGSARSKEIERRFLRYSKTITPGYR